jgi:hypothetical protein
MDLTKKKSFRTLLRRTRAKMVANKIGEFRILFLRQMTSIFVSLSSSFRSQKTLSSEFVNFDGKNFCSQTNFCFW